MNYLYEKFIKITVITEDGDFQALTTAAFVSVLPSPVLIPTCGILLKIKFAAKSIYFFAEKYRNACEIQSHSVESNR